MTYTYNQLISSPYPIARGLIKYGTCNDPFLDKMRLILGDDAKATHHEYQQSLYGKDNPSGIETDVLSHVFIHLIDARDCKLWKDCTTKRKIVWSDVCEATLIISNWVIRYHDKKEIRKDKITRYTSLVDLLNHSDILKMIVNWTYEILTEWDMMTPKREDPYNDAFTIRNVNIMYDIVNREDW